MTINASPTSLRPALLAGIILGCALVLPALVRAEDQPAAANPPSVSEKTSEAFRKLTPLNETKDWDGMLAVLDSLVPTLDPMSYDMFKIQDMKARLYGQKEQYDKAVDAWTKALAISDVKKYYDPKDQQQTLLFLAQFSYQEGTASKVPAVQQTYINKAAGYFKRYLASEQHPSADIEMFYASLLYNQAVVDPAKVDQSLLKQAHAEVNKALAASIHPKEGLYVLLLAILQQENDLVHSAETLELILSQYPTKKDYWPSLWSTYLAMANDKDPEKVRENYIRAINTMERAQALGFMNTPKDKLNLVNLYLTAGQFSKGTDILHKGLKDGTIESDVKNWLALGYYYQQANRDLEAISALKEASALFPTNGQIDLTIAEIYRGKDLFKEARDFYRSALKKGGLEKPYLVWAYLANASFTLEDFDDAKTAIEQAEKFPESGKDSFLPQLKEAVNHAIAERDAQKTQTPAP